MKTKFPCLLIGLALSASLHQAAAQGTAFTYQGRLNDGGNPATGNYDLEFYLRNALTAGNAVGNTNTLPLVPVTNGLFTVSLDFGAGVFTGTNYWLEIGVRTNGSVAAYSILTPRQALTPVPYAIMANSASNLLGTVAASQLSGPVSSGNLSGTYGNAVTFNNSGNSYAGNGAKLTGVNAAKLGGLAAGNFWQTGGNAGTTAGVNYVGTTDNQPLELHVNGARALRLEPNSSGVNVIAGAANNSVATYGAMIGGGGGNQIQTNAYDSTIGGGNNNQIQTNAYNSTVGGGNNNQILTNSSGATIGEALATPSARLVPLLVEEGMTASMCKILGI